MKGLMCDPQRARMNVHSASLGMACNQHIEFPAVVRFLDRVYRYTSVVIQIPHDVGLAPFPYTGQIPLTQESNQRRIS